VLVLSAKPLVYPALSRNAHVREPQSSPVIAPAQYRFGRLAVRLACWKEVPRFHERIIHLQPDRRDSRVASTTDRCTDDFIDSYYSIIRRVALKRFRVRALPNIRQQALVVGRTVWQLGRNVILRTEFDPRGRATSTSIGNSYSIASSEDGWLWWTLLNIGASL